MLQYKRIVVLAFLLLGFSGFTVAQVPDSECVDNPDSPACQFPLYADDQAEYLYDLRGSWVFGGIGAPTTDGPTVFEGGEAVDLGQQVEQDHVNEEEDEKTEYYIEDAGEAEDGIQQGWGRGTLTSTILNIDNAKKGTGTHGEYLISPPYQGMCGDGQRNTGGTTTCPEDWGTPTPIELDFLPPQSTTIEYDEGGTKTETFTDHESAEDIHIEGEYNEESPDLHSHDEEYIYRDEVEESTVELTSEPLIHLAENPDGQQPTSTHYQEQDTRTVYEGENRTSPSSTCTERSPVESQYLQPVQEMHSEETTITDNDAESYEAVDQTQTSTAEATITHNTDYTPTPDSQHYQCAEGGFETIYTECSEEPAYIYCTEINDFEYYPSAGTQEIYAVTETDFTVTRDDYEIQREIEWGSVNSRPDDLFSQYSQVEVVNTNFGYHTQVQNDNKQGSNNPSVSANQYKIQEQGEGQYFQAVRETSNVANADGPDGELNGIVAYHEEEGIKGGTIELGNEIWNGQANYITQNSIENKIESEGGCPGDTIRCVASIDIRTRQTGWGTQPQTSYEIKIE